MNDVFLSIGTNIGNRLAQLQQCVQLLRERFDVIRISSIYETAPIGYEQQASFFNIAVYVQTTHSAQETLEMCQEIEQQMGRERTIRWGPRTIDVDVLLYNLETIATEPLMIPHPRMYERAFVLVPFIEIAESFTAPLFEVARQALEKIDIEQQGVVKWRAVHSVETFLAMKE